MSFRDYLYGLATDRISGPVNCAVKIFLHFLSFIYGLIIAALIFLRRLKKKHLACRVISVGNITLGGTGKTVMVELIAGYLKGHGHKVAVLSRGYKRPRPAGADSLPSYQTMGDEPFMISQKLGNVPVLVDPDRARSAENAVIRYAADTVILDDGLQQWGIKKDLEIVMLDAARPFGNRHLIPRGTLRQPVRSLNTADVFVITDPQAADTGALKEMLHKISPRALILDAEHSALGIYRLSRRQEVFAPGFLNGKSAVLFCGIGNPGSFRVLSAGCGIKESAFFGFADHYRYEEDDIERIVHETASKGADVVLTTEKDAVRIPLAARKRFGENIFILSAGLKIKNEEKRFFDRLLQLYSA